MALHLSNEVECGRCGKRYAWTPQRAGTTVACSCGQSIAMPAAAPSGEDSPVGELDEAGAGEASDVPAGVTELTVPQGMLWIVPGAAGVDAYLLTDSELRYKVAIAGSDKKFQKLMAEKSDIEEVAKHKWTTTIALGSILRMERSDIDSHTVIHYRNEKGREKSLAVSKEGTNIHAIVFDSVRAVLAPDKATVKVRLGTWEILSGPFWGGVVTVGLGALMIWLSTVANAPRGKGFLIWWVASTVGTIGCAVVMLLVLGLVIRWGMQRFVASPMKDVLIVSQ